MVGSVGRPTEVRDRRTETGSGGRSHLLQDRWALMARSLKSRCHSRVSVVRWPGAWPEAVGVSSHPSWRHLGLSLVGQPASSTSFRRRPKGAVFGQRVPIHNKFKSTVAHFCSVLWGSRRPDPGLPHSCVGRCLAQLAHPTRHVGAASTLSEPTHAFTPSMLEGIALRMSWLAATSSICDWTRFATFAWIRPNLEWS